MHLSHLDFSSHNPLLVVFLFLSGSIFWHMSTYDVLFQAGSLARQQERLLQKDGPHLESLYLCNQNLPINEPLITLKGP